MLIKGGILARARANIAVPMPSYQPADNLPIGKFGELAAARTW